MSYRLFDPTANPDLTNASGVAGLRTVTTVPVEVFAGASRLASRGRVAARNLSTDTRVRIGATAGTLLADGTSSLQRDGVIVEPGELVTVYIDTAVPLPLYACSEGCAVTLQVEEN